jgi:hypothetical protein
LAQKERKNGQERLIKALLFKFDSILNKFETLFLCLMLNSLPVDEWIGRKKINALYSKQLTD